MNGEGTKDIDVIDDDDVATDPEETVVLTEVDDDDVDLSETVANLNVEELVKVVESANSEEVAKQRAAKKKLEELQEKLHKDDEFGSTYAFDLDDDLTT